MIVDRLSLDAAETVTRQQREQEAAAQSILITTQIATIAALKRELAYEQQRRENVQAAYDFLRDTSDALAAELNRIKQQQSQSGDRL